MTKADVLKLRPADLRRTASRTHEPERERKMLALADQLEEAERDEQGADEVTRDDPMLRDSKARR